MNTKRIFNKVIAYVIVFSIILSGMVIPKGAVKAEELSLDLKPDTSSHTVSASISGDTSQLDINIDAPSGYSTVQSLIDAGYASLEIGYKVSEYTPSSNGTPGVLPYIAHGDSWKYSTDGWKNLSDASEGTVTIALSNATASDEIKRFGLLICNVSGDVTYQITSAVLTGSGSGTGGGSSGGADDNTTDIVSDIEYNYAKLLQESLYFYDANMCGTDVKEKSELSWRDNCHTGDSNVTYAGKTIDLSGGYHDAGDHAKFGLPQAYAASTLGISYYQFKEAFTDLNLTSHYKRIMDRFVDYFERCTVLDDSGKVKAFCYQVGSGNTDHSYWGAPENQPDRSSQVWFTDINTPATDIVCETAAALAIYYMNFKSTDSKNADKALLYSKLLFDYAESFGSKSCVKIEIDNATGAPFYNSTSWEDDYALAAAWLYKATGDSVYSSAYNNVYGSKNWVGWVLSWDDVSSIAMLYGPNESQRRYVAEYVTNTINSKTQSSDNNYVKIESWGSARYNCSLQMMGLIYDSNQYGSFANGQMKYLLGNNAGKHCFVIGYNKYSVKYPHHRAASGYEGSVSGTREQAHSLVGALVGGPSSSSSSYVDTADDYNQNEVALDYNAGLVGATAGLYLYIKAKGTDEEKAAQKTVSKSEISNELRNVQDESTEEPENPEIKVAGIVLNKTEVSLYAGETETISATVSPADATDKSVVWSSTDNSVVSVNNGMLTALKKGSATVTVTAKDGSGVSASCNVTVKSLGKLVSDTASINMTSIVYGYSSADAEAAKVSVTLGNTGDKTVSGLSATLDSGLSFELSNISESELVAGKNSIITIKPKTQLNAGTYSDVLVITSDSGSYNIPILFTVKKAESDTVVKLSQRSITYSSISLDADISGSIKNIEYAITTDKNADTSRLVWQNEGIFTNLTEFTAYYLYARSKADSNHNSGSISDVLTATTFARNPYTIDISKITSTDCEYIKALKDTNGISTAEVFVKDGILTLSLTNKNMPYTIIGSNNKLNILADGISNITLKNAEFAGLELYMPSSDSLNLKIEGTNAISKGISFNKDKTDVSSKLIISSEDKNGVLNIYSEGVPAIKAFETLVISSGNINISSDYQCISAGTIMLEGGNVQATITGSAASKPAIEAQKDIYLVGGIISVTTPSENDIAFDVAEGGRIVIDGSVTIIGKPVYGVLPVDKDGNIINTVNVTFTDDIGNVLATYQIKTGGTLDLGKLEIKKPDGLDYSASKEGYKLSWTDGRNNYSTDQKILSINSDITFKAVWTWIVVDISKTSINDLNSFVYTGKAITPSISVTYKNNKLINGTDYTVAYENNTNIGIANVIITGKGKFNGKITKTFQIIVKKGKVYKVGNYKYKITNASTNGKGTVMLTGVTKKRAKVIIKGTAKIGGKSFKITAIGDKAFRKNKTIKKLIIPSSITRIGKQAFYGCSKLKSITINSLKLKSKNIGIKAFKGINKKAVIKVPKTKLKAYRKIFKSKGLPKTVTIKKK